MEKVYVIRHDGSGYSYVKNKRKIKSDWAGISIGDGFKNNLDYYTKMTAQKKFYNEINAVRKKVVAFLKVTQGEREFQKVKAQLDPFYTSFPKNLAAQASIGLTAFLQFEELTRSSLFVKHLARYLKDPAAHDEVSCNPSIYNQCVNSAAVYIQTRLYLEEMFKSLNLPSIEMYRVYSASQQDMSFPSLNHILRAVVLYGDILPGADNFDLHSLTSSIYQDMVNLSRTRYDEFAYYQEYQGENGLILISLGQFWLREIAKSIIKYLPPKKVGKRQENRANSPLEIPPFQRQDRFPHPDELPEEKPEKINPLNKPTPPSLNDSSNAAKNAHKSRETSQDTQKLGKSEFNKTSEVEETFKSLNEAVYKASMAQADFEDTRSDLMEKSAETQPFKNSKIEGVPSEGHEVTVKMKNDEQIQGEIFDRRVELSDDFEKLQKLMDGSEGVISSLRRSIYPNIKESPVPLNLRTSGSLDPGRLPLASFSSTVFRRYDIVNRQDKEGKPVLVIACDGSGSLDPNQMNMLKILANSWMYSTVGTGIKTLSALYHSGDIRKGVNGPLVQWMYHPDKTPNVSAHEVTRAIASLPDTGTGIQSDALSISFILQEAEKVARGNAIYLVLISDCCWNYSHRSQMTGYEEVRNYFEQRYEDMAGKLHTTLVALGVEEQTRLEDIMDKVIPVSHQDLKNTPAVAEKIGLYVASCMRERQRLVREAV